MPLGHDTPLCPGVPGPAVGRPDQRHPLNLPGTRADAGLRSRPGNGKGKKPWHGDRPGYGKSTSRCKRASRRQARRVARAPALTRTSSNTNGDSKAGFYTHMPANPSTHRGEVRERQLACFAAVAIATPSRAALRGASRRRAAGTIAHLPPVQIRPSPITTRCRSIAARPREMRPPRSGAQAVHFPRTAARRLGAGRAHRRRNRKQTRPTCDRASSIFFFTKGDGLSQADRVGIKPDPPGFASQPTKAQDAP